MKIVIVLLLINIPLIVFSQNKNNVYADIACTPFALGGSATWDKKIIKHVDVGLGGQINDYWNVATEKIDGNNIRKALYLDLRPYIIRKRSLLFFLCDIGYDFYHGARNNWNNNPDNAFYSGAGLGYGRVLNKRGVSIYATVKLVSDDYIEHQYVYGGNNNGGYVEDDYFALDLFFVFSVGVKL